MLLSVPHQHRSGITDAGHSSIAYIDNVFVKKRWLDSGQKLALIMLVKGEKLFFTKVYVVALAKELQQFFGYAGIFGKYNLGLLEGRKSPESNIGQIADRGGNESEQLLEIVFFLESIDPSGSIDDLFATCKERVALVADFDFELRFI
jgi:hypothetical protein